MTMFYWPVKSRGYAIMAVAKAGGINLVQDGAFDLAALKPELPFGQVPYLVHGDVKLAQVFKQGLSKILIIAY